MAIIKNIENSVKYILRRRFSPGWGLSPTFAGKHDVSSV